MFSKLYEISSEYDLGDDDFSIIVIADKEDQVLKYIRDYCNNQGLDFNEEIDETFSYRKIDIYQVALDLRGE